jgi:hypothetical protein
MSDECTARESLSLSAVVEEKKRSVSMGEKSGLRVALSSAKYRVRFGCDEGFWRESGAFEGLGEGGEREAAEVSSKRARPQTPF